MQHSSRNTAMDLKKYHPHIPFSRDVSLAYRTPFAARIISNREYIRNIKEEVS